MFKTTKVTNEVPKYYKTRFSRVGAPLIGTSGALYGIGYGLSKVLGKNDDITTSQESVAYVPDFTVPVTPQVADTTGGQIIGRPIVTEPQTQLDSVRAILGADADSIFGL